MMNQMKKIADDVVTFNPDGMTINVPWESFVTGASFFLPCINTTEAKKLLQINNGEQYPYPDVATGLDNLPAL